MSELIDNRAHRIRTLKDIIRHLHAGKDADEVRGMLQKMVQETDATEIAAMEQELISEGMPVEEVQSMCDLHSQVLQSVMTDRTPPDVPPGHPVDTFQRENEALESLLERMRGELATLAQATSEDEKTSALNTVRGSYNELMDVDAHYKRKENLLFSFLEHHGITGPPKVMWGKDDEVRDFLRVLGDALKEGADAAAIEAAAVPALFAVQEMIFKEGQILFPMSLNTLTEDEWGEIHEQSPEYGWCIVEPREGYEAPTPKKPLDPADVPVDRSLRFPTGALTMDQVKGVLGALPVDVTFVDADDRVRYFSEGEDRVFARSKAILGRKVQHCHPPASVDVVEQIVGDFRSGRQSVAEFWIELHGKFIHIRYFAVRDDAGEYLGTVEITQDVTRIRGLEGDRRLLTYDSPSDDD